MQLRKRDLGQASDKGSSVCGTHLLLPGDALPLVTQ